VKCLQAELTTKDRMLKLTTNDGGGRRLQLRINLRTIKKMKMLVNDSLDTGDSCPNMIGLLLRQPPQLFSVRFLCTRGRTAAMSNLTSGLTDYVEFDAK
jgi:hypothetical protein